MRYRDGLKDSNIYVYVQQTLIRNSEIHENLIADPSLFVISLYFFLNFISD